MEDRPSILRELRICRFCLTEQEPLTNIYVKDKSNSIPLPLQIMACVALEVFANDGMPQLICDSCRTQTRKSYSFKTICKRSDDALKLYLATGVLKRGDEEVETNVTCKRSSEMGNTPEPKRKKSVEEPKIEALKQEIISVPQESTKKSDERINEPEKNEESQNGSEIPENVPENVVEEVIESETADFDNIQIITDPTLDEEVMEFDDVISVPPKVPQVATQCFPCPNCERSFPLQQLLDIHTRQHTRERKFNCTECTKKFFSKHDLTKHCLTHSGSKPFTCVICDKSFSRATLLHRHEKVHVSVPKYLCTYCDKTYLVSEDLDAHMRSHKKNRPFQCSQCDKKFAFKQGLERHETTHSAENPYKCNYCEESFSTPSKLQRHITFHAGARPYPCKLCPRTFLLSHHLTRHLRNHYSRKSKGDETGEHKCDVCSMSFKRRYSLINHSAIHSMVNLKCVICNKEFEDAQTVKEHITSHLSGLPFMCFKCEYSFENEDDLVEHEQKHYGNSESGSDSEDVKNEAQNVEESTPRRSQRDKKVKNYADFLKDEDFSESEENIEESDEEFVATPSKNTIQPVVRSETMKVYKGVKDKTHTPVPAPPKPLETSTPLPRESKTLTKITTLENLGLSKSTLDAMTDKSGFVEMKIGQKVIRVQKLMMTKADVQAMAEQGKIEMKGTKVVVKNTGAGLLNLNKLTNITQTSPLMVEEGSLSQGSNLKGVRTYVKKLIKKEEVDSPSEEIKEVAIAESIDIDVKDSNTDQIIEESNMINF